MAYHRKIFRIVGIATIGAVIALPSHAAHAKCFSSSATTTNASKASAISYARSQAQKAARRKCQSRSPKYSCKFPKKKGLNLHARCSSMSAAPNNGRDGVVWTCKVVSTACSRVTF